MEQAILDLKWAAQRFKGIIEVIPDLDKIVSLSSVIEEKTKQVNDLSDVVKTKTEESGILDAKIRDVRKQIEGYYNQSKIDTANAIKVANDTAEEIVADSEVKAKKIVEAATADVRDQYQKLDRLQKECADLEKVIQDRQAYLKTVEDKLAQLRNSI